MERYLEVLKNGYSNYFNYLIGEITQPSWHSYFYLLILISLFFWLLEIFFPWRKQQKMFRKDFFLDFFYMFFNFFIFSLIGFHALSDVVVLFINDLLLSIGINRIDFVDVSTWSTFSQLFILFIVKDFVHFNIHRLLHYVPFLWNFHKVHHSVKEMGFAAHLRYHWVENIIYKALQYLPLAIIGFGIQEFIIVHVFTIFVGHFNHSNIKINLGIFKYIFNNPQMHLWHHAKNIPYKHGVNFGLTLSIWDYIFKTNYQPNDNENIELGFDGDESFPKSFLKQEFYSIFKND